MKLSEAIRLGAMLKPQGHDMLVTLNGGSCALGAAFDAVGMAVGEYDGGDAGDPCYAEARARWSVLNAHVACPVPDSDVWRDGDMVHVIWSLNDRAGWTREQIADWVATIEAQHEQPAAPIETPATVR